MPTPDDWPDALRDLDTLRARAFATRDAGLLARVYPPGRLRAADTATLLHTVPAGCRLIGARTRYDSITVRATRAQATLTLSATLPPSTLVCSGRPKRRVRGVDPTRLRVRIVGTGADRRIVEQRQL